MEALTFQSSISIEQLYAIVRQLPRTEKIKLSEILFEDETESKEAILTGLKEAMHEVQLHQAGKIKLQSAKEWLNGL